MTPDWLRHLAEACWAQSNPEGQYPPRIPAVDELAAFVRDHAMAADHAACSERPPRAFDRRIIREHGQGNTNRVSGGSAYGK